MDREAEAGHLAALRAIFQQPVRQRMKTETLNPELLGKMDAYWRAANYLSIGQI